MFFDFSCIFFEKVFEKVQQVFFSKPQKFLDREKDCQLWLRWHGWPKLWTTQKQTWCQPFRTLSSEILSYFEGYILAIQFYFINKPQKCFHLSRQMGKRFPKKLFPLALNSAEQWKSNWTETTAQDSLQLHLNLHLSETLSGFLLCYPKAFTAD